MRTSKLIILILILWVNPAMAQRDTICFDVSVARKMHTEAQQKKLCDSLVVVLQQNISAYKVIVRELNSKDSVNHEIIAIYKQQIRIMEKEIRKWKRKTRWTAIAGVVGVGAAIWIFK